MSTNFEAGLDQTIRPQGADSSFLSTDTYSISRLYATSVVPDQKVDAIFGTPEWSCATPLVDTAAELEVDGKEKLTPEEVTEKEAKDLAHLIDRDSRWAIIDSVRKDAFLKKIHDEFERQLKKTEGKEPTERAAELKKFAEKVNDHLLRAKHTYSLEAREGDSPNKIKFEMVNILRDLLYMGKASTSVVDSHQYDLKKKP